jgi:hypothetical protein
MKTNSDCTDVSSKFLSPLLERFIVHIFSFVVIKKAAIEGKSANGLDVP